MLSNFVFILILLSNAITPGNSIPELGEYCSFETGKYAFLKGNYKVWCFGAKGGDSFASGGSGAKIFGKLILTQETEISIITGEIGADRHHGGTGGKPDGANSKNRDYTRRGGGGGSSSLSIDGNKILVAAGGSGAYTRKNGDQFNGSPGGDFTYNFKCANKYCKDPIAVQEFASNCPATWDEISNTDNVRGSGSGGGYQCGKLVNSKDDGYPKVSYGGLSFFNETYFQDTNILAGNNKIGNKEGGKVSIIPYCNGKCEKCNCTGFCEQCKNGYILDNNECILVCSDGFYYDPETDKCKSYCSNGSYWDRETNECIKCNAFCTNCSSKTECLSCKAGYHLKDSNCIPPTSYRFDIYSSLNWNISRIPRKRG